MIILVAVILSIITAFYVLLQNHRVQTFLTQKLADRFSEQLHTKIHIGGIDVAFFNKVILEEFWAEDFNTDTLAYINRMVASLDSFSIRKRFVSLKNFSFDQSKLYLSTDSLGSWNYRFPETSETAATDTSPQWKIYCNDFEFKNATMLFRPGNPDNQPISLSNINFRIGDLIYRDDSLLCSLESFSLKGNDNFSIDRFSSVISVSGPNISLKNINIDTRKSYLHNSDLEIVLQDTIDNVLPSFNLDIGQSVINLADLALFIPSMDGMDQDVQLSGAIYGRISDLKGRNILMQFGENTLARFDFYLNGLPNLANTYVSFDLRHLQTTFADLHNINLPESAGVKHLVFPDSFYQSGLLTYKGNFTGFFSDFVTYGTFEGPMGQITTDLSITPAKGKKIELDGKLSTTGFNIGELFKEPLLGNIVFDGEVNGEFDEIMKDFAGTFKGGVAECYANGYTYRNISIDGEFSNKDFDGMFKVNDPNLKLDFRGRLNFNNPIPVFDFGLDLQNADLNALQLDAENIVSKVSGKVRANFSGNNIDNLIGSIDIENGSYQNKNGQLEFGKAQIKTETIKSNRLLTLNSDFADAKVLGKYNLKTFPLTFRYILSNYISVLQKTNETGPEIDNNFEYTIDIKQTDRLLAILKPGFSIGMPGKIEGEIDGRNNLFFLEGTIPSIKYNGLTLQDISFRSASNNAYTAKVKVGLVQVGAGIKIYNASLNSEAKNNTIDTRLTWNNYHQLSYSGELNLVTTLTGSPEKIYSLIEVNPSKVYVADSLWEVGRGRIIVDSTAITMSGITVNDGQQWVDISGKISENPDDRLTFTLKNIDLGKVENYLQAEPSLEGTINGNAELVDFYGNQKLFADVKIKQLKANHQLLGDVALVNSWDEFNSVLNTNLTITDNEKEQLTAKGFYNPATQEYEYNTMVNHFPVSILKQFITEGLSDFGGTTSGHLKIYGKPDDIMMDGSLLGENASVTIDFTKVNYHFTDSVRFDKRTIRFDNITIFDSQNNQGKFNGTISHHNYSNMVYNLRISSQKILAMNTTIRDNGIFYGKVVANGNFLITGKGVNINLGGEGKTLAGSDISISLEYEEDAAQYDFIRFVDKSFNKDKGIIFTNSADTAFNLDLQIEVTPEAKAQFIYNSMIGDVIKVQGEGVLQFGMDKNGDITLKGNCIIQQGDYLFTLKNVINKRFTIEPGGTISWSGDPYNATIDLSAIYSLKASLKDLLVDEIQSVDGTLRIPVDCKIKLTDNLMNPAIRFEISFPITETRLIDKLLQFINTDEEVQRQVISLVMIGQFYTPEYKRGTFDASATATPTDVIGSAAGELLSNQLSNILSQTINNLDVGFSYRPGGQVSKDEIELALSKQLFNNRVTINGNIGNNVNPFGNSNNQIVGDFDLKLKLNNSGKIQLKAFNRSNDNIIYETAPYTQGIGLSFKEDFDNYSELLNKISDIFRSKKDTVTQPILK